MNDFDPVEAAIQRRANADAKVNAVLQNTLHARLAEIDARKYAESRDRLTVNRDGRTPTPRVFIPSRCRVQVEP